MKVTLAQIYFSQDSFKNIISIPLPPKISYKLSKLTTQLDEEFKAIEKSRMNLIQKYGVQDEKNPDIWQVPMDSFSEFDEELQNFLKDETIIESDIIEIKIDDMKDNTITTQDFILLKPFINFIE